MDSGIWLTTTELQKQGIHRRRALRWARKWEQEGLTRRTGDGRGRGSNPWLFSPEAIKRLKKKRDFPLEPTLQEVVQLEQAWEKYHTITAVKEAIGHSWLVAKRWLRERGYLNNR